jgi:hypothetical protein
MAELLECVWMERTEMRALESHMGKMQHRKVRNCEKAQEILALRKGRRAHASRKAASYSLHVLRFPDTGPMGGIFFHTPRH